MEFIVIGGQPNEDLPKYVFENIDFGGHNTKLIEGEGKRSQYTHLRFPEYEHRHPKVCFDEVVKFAKNCIINNRSLYVTTFSEHVLNAIRVAIKESEKSFPAECHQLYDGGHVTVSKISKDGALNNWQEGVWDAWDDALVRLF